MLTNFYLNYMPKKIYVQDVYPALLKKTGENLYKFSLNLVRKINHINGTIAISVVMFGTIIQIA